MKDITLGLDLASTSSGAVILDGAQLIHFELIQPVDEMKNPLERLAFIFRRVSELFDEYDILNVAIEDIGLNAGMRNFSVAQTNLLLIGGCLALANLHGCIVLLMKPSEWRKVVGVYRDQVTREEMHREFQKQKGIELANEYFGFGFKWVSEYQDKKDHHSDIAEASLIALASYKIFKKGG